jgi:hypothetical protein
MRLKALIPALVVLISALPASAQTPAARLTGGLAEEVLTRAVLERAAFAACAATSPDAASAMETLRRGWQLDLADTTKLLAENGVPAETVRAIAARFDLDAATPRFATDAARSAFCAVVGTGGCATSSFAI